MLSSLSFFLEGKSTVNERTKYFEEIAENNKPKMSTRSASKAKNDTKLTEESYLKDLKESHEKKELFNVNEEKRVSETENYQKLLKENEENKERYQKLLKENEENKESYQKLLKENEENKKGYQKFSTENQGMLGSFNKGESFQKFLKEKEQLKLALRDKDQECNTLKIAAEKTKICDSKEIKTLNDKILDLENIIKTKDREIERLRIEVGKNRNVPSPTVSDDESSSAKRRKPTECRWNILTSVD